MDLCSLNSPLSPLWLSVPLQIYALSTLSPLCLPPSLPLFLLSSVSPSCVSTALCLTLCLHTVYALCLSHLVSLPLSFPSVSSLLSLSLRFSSCLFPLSLPLSFPLYLPLSLFSISPLCLFSFGLSSCISSLLSPSLHLPSCTSYVYLIHNFRDNRLNEKVRDNREIMIIV
jgi:hypothetical protein